jgi:hypothetical protein
MMRRWIMVALVVFAVLDLAVLAVGYRTRSGVLPPWQVQEPRFRMQPAALSTVPATPASENAIAGPVLMAVDATGLVVRATRGACQERFDNPAQVSVGSVRDGNGLADVDVPDVIEVLGVSVLPDSHLRVAGLDQDCQVVTVDSTDQGQTWKRLASAGIWRLDGDTTAAVVTGPAGKAVPLSCVPRQLLNLPATRALASCDGGAFYVLATAAEPAPLTADGYSGLSVSAATRAGDYYTLGTTDDCVAQVGVLARNRQTVRAADCLDSDTEPRSPLAIASAGDLVVVQIGEQLMASEDRGSSFDVVA